MWIRIVEFVVLILFNLGCSTNLENGDELFEKGNFKLAIDSYEKVEGNSSDYGMAQKKIGHAYMKLGEMEFDNRNWSRAISYLESVHTDHPDYSIAQKKIENSSFELGQQLYQEEEWKSALTYLDLVRPENPYYNQARDLYKKAKEQDTLKTFKDSLIGTWSNSDGIGSYTKYTFYADNTYEINSHLSKTLNPRGLYPDEKKTGKWSMSVDKDGKLRVRIHRVYEGIQAEVMGGQDEIAQDFREIAQVLIKNRYDYSFVIKSTSLSGIGESETIYFKE